MPYERPHRGAGKGESGNSPRVMARPRSALRGRALTGFTRRQRFRDRVLGAARDQTRVVSLPTYGVKLCATRPDIERFDARPGRMSSQCARSMPPRAARFLAVM